MNLTLTFLLLVCFGFLSYSQQSEPFLDLMDSQGNVPSAFLNNKRKLPGELNDRTVDDNNELIVRELLHSGQVLYGGEMTEYIRQIASEILKDDPDLFRQLSFFIYRSSDELSFSTSSGLVFVSTGLISQLSNEDQLAFAIAREIGHFVNKHKNYPFIRYEDSYAEGKGTYEYKKTFGTFFIRTVEENIVADAYAVKLLKQSGVEMASAISYFDALLYAYLPFDEVEINHTFFNLDTSFVIPSAYFQKTDVSIDSEENGDSNRHLFMEGIRERKAAVVEIIGIPENNIKMKEATDRFLRFRTAARFEVVRMNLVSREYILALYHSFILLQQHPENDFLERAFIKAIYAISVYRMNDADKDIDLDNYQGEISKLGNVLGSLSEEQVGVLAMMHIKNYVNSHPEDEYMISLLESTVQNLKNASGFQYSSFRSMSYLNDQTSELKDTLNLSKYDKIKMSRREFALENYEKDFHLYVLDFINTDSLVQVCFDREEMNYSESNPTGIKSVLVMNPVLRNKNLKFGLDLLLSESQLSVLSKAIENNSSFDSLRVRYLNILALDSTDWEEFNAISAIKIWFSESAKHLFLKDFVSLESDMLYPYIKKNGTRYILFSRAEGKDKQSIFSSYSLGLFDLTSGKLLHKAQLVHQVNYQNQVFMRLFNKMMDDIK